MWNVAFIKQYANQFAALPSLQSFFIGCQFVEESAGIVLHGSWEELCLRPCPQNGWVFEGKSHLTSVNINKWQLLYRVCTRLQLSEIVKWDDWNDINTVLIRTDPTSGNNTVLNGRTILSHNRRSGQVRCERVTLVKDSRTLFRPGPFSPRSTQNTLVPFLSFWAQCCGGETTRLCSQLASHEEVMKHRVKKHRVNRKGQTRMIHTEESSAFMAWNSLDSLRMVSITCRGQWGSYPPYSSFGNLLFIPFHVMSI